MDASETVLQLQGSGMRAQPEVVVVAVQLRLVAVATRKLIHGREFEVALVHVVVHHGSWHVEDAVLFGAVAVEEVVAEACLQALREEVSYLPVAAPEVVRLVDFLPLGKADVHPVGFRRGVPAAVQHAPLHADARIVRALAFALHVDASAHAEKHVPTREHVAVALRGRHIAPRHEGEAAGIKQGGDVGVVGERLRRRVDAAAATVPKAQLVTHQPAVLPLRSELELTVKLEAEVEAHADGGRHGVQAVRHDDGSRQRGRQAGKQRLTQRGEVGVEERRLELAGTKACGGRDAVVHPSLLQDVPAAACRVDAQVVVEPTEGCAGKAKDGIGHREARVRHVVLVVGFVQTLVVVVMVLASRLQKEVWLEDEAAVARLQREASVVRNAQHAVLHVDVLLLLPEVSTLEVVLLKRDVSLLLVLLGQSRQDEKAG